MTQLKPLIDEQLRAADPAKSAWVSASAGTGKTQVLTARVLRLLLAGARPEALLALTFTKAAAAEMQTRIFDTLGRWVRATDAALGAELCAIGAPDDAETRSLARSLFATALEVRGGLRVQTLHSFASTLLSAFPLEAGITPGYKTLDDRDAVRLRDDVLAARAEQGGPDFRADLAALSVRAGETGVRDIVAGLIKSRAFDREYKDPGIWLAAVRRALGVPALGSRAEILAAALADDAFDWAAVKDFAAANAAWGTRTGLETADALAAVRALTAELQVEVLRGIAFTGKGERTKPKIKGPEAEALHGRFCDVVERLVAVANALEVADIAALHLRVGHALASDYRAAKHEAGALDYDDLIVRAAELLKSFDAAYVLYKLDQRIDHILVDEGQDTNAAQWAIIAAIADEFFAGKGAHDELRTQFAVGDYKQAIFGFQGTNPEEFERARAAAGTRAAAAGQAFENVDLVRSFRSVAAVLDVVDKVIENVGSAAFGVTGEIPKHEPHRKGEAGQVVLWPAITGDLGDGDDGDDAEPIDAVRELARRVATEIAGWIARGERRESNGKPIRAGDVLILVRSRGELVPALVAALHRARVPVAGADRLRLTAPIAVKDVLALARFALQPGDDLSLAALLVSPFLGWTQQQLFDVAHGRPKGTTLWRAVRESKLPFAVEAEAWLGQVLARADYLPPYEFFESILSGELEGRARLLARLGEEARDPIEEVLNQALLFEATNSPSLQAFLQWIDTDDVEVKRDPDAPRDAVRIMTVHGAKGLQAPIVIMADAATAAPKAIKQPIALDLPEIGATPIYYGSKELLTGAARKAYDAKVRAEAEETMRLLYVAMTRAEDRLYVGGAIGKRGITADGWYEHVKRALTALDATTETVEPWGEVQRYAKGKVAAPATAEEAATPSAKFALPLWASMPAPAEERPPRPLAPSAAGDDAGIAFPPASPAMQAAARRGQVLHQLFERIGGVSEAKREAAMRAWLARNAPDLEAGGVIAEVLAVLDHPEAAPFFAADALAEAPLSALVDDRAVTGVLDRLLIADGHVAALDFKTGMRVPDSLAAIPASHTGQMRAYSAALRKIFPGRTVTVALLYTSGPRLFVLDEAALGGG